MKGMSMGGGNATGQGDMPSMPKKRDMGTASVPRLPDLSGPEHQHLGHFARPDVVARGHNTTERVVIRAKGQPPIGFKKGALHAQLGVPQGQPIPAGKKQAALEGRYGPLAKKRATFAYKGALAAGRKTARRGK